MVVKKRKVCKNCGSRGRIHQYIMRSYHAPEEQRDIFFDYVCCRCRGSGYTWEKEYKDGTKDVRRKALS